MNNHKPRSEAASTTAVTDTPVSDLTPVKFICVGKMPVDDHGADIIRESNVWRALSMLSESESPTLYPVDADNLPILLAAPKGTLNDVHVVDFGDLQQIPGGPRLASIYPVINDDQFSSFISDWRHNEMRIAQDPVRRLREAIETFDTRVNPEQADNET